MLGPGESTEAALTEFAEGKPAFGLVLCGGFCFKDSAREYPLREVVVSAGASSVRDEHPAMKEELLQRALGQCCSAPDMRCPLSSVFDLP